MTEPIIERDPVEVLAEEFRDRLRRGERPDVEEYARRHPEHAAAIRDLFPALLMVEELKGAGAGDALTMAPGAQPPLASPVEQLGDYRVLREVGRGGMGIVYEAEQVSLGRRVALKVLPASVLSDDRQRRRFQREARSAARLHHTNIVPVYGVGEADGTQYYVMQLIQGQGLDTVLAELRRLRGPREPVTAGPAADVARSLVSGCFTMPITPSASSDALPPQSVRAPAGVPCPTPASGSMAGGGRAYWHSVARIGAQVADALDYAASQGVLHRDVKPSNILLDAQGNAWVADFGLAKVTADENLTHTAELLGTLRYMAPERFEGRSDVRSDIYALGLTLYELLTLKPAVSATDPAKVMAQVTTETPVPPRAIDPAIPRDLETIVLKAIAREPGRRYQSASDLATDLRSFLEDRPIKARRVGLAERFLRWCRRNPVVATLTAGIAMLLVGGSAAALAAAIHAEQLARQERLARDEAIREQTQAEQDLAQARTEQVAAEKARTSEADLRIKAEADHADAEKSRQDATAAAQLAERHSQNARTVVDAFVMRVRASPALRGPEMRRLRHTLLLSALPFYQKLIADHAGDAAPLPGLAGAHYYIGEIQDGIGNAALARTEYEAAVALYRALVAADPDKVEFQAGLARSQLGAGAPHEAVRTWEHLLTIEPTSRFHQEALARAQAAHAAQLGTVHNAAGALAATVAYERAQALWTALVDTDLDNADTRAELARTMFAQAQMLADGGRRLEAERQLSEGIRHARHALDRSPQLLEYGRLLARGYQQMAELHRARVPGEALPWYEQTVQLWQRLAEESPMLATPRAELYHSRLRLAACHRALGHAKEADAASAAAAAVLDTLPRQSPEDDYYAACVLALVARDADASASKTIAGRAMDALGRAVASGLDAVERLQDEADLDTLRTRPDFRALLARAEHARKERLAARTPAVIEAERVAARRTAQADLAAGHYAVGLGLIGVGNHAAAREPLLQSRKLREVLIEEDPDHAAQHRTELGLTHVALGDVHMKAGRWADALRAWRAGADLLESAGAAERDIPLRGRLADAERRVANGYAALGLWDECGEMWRRAFAHRPSDKAVDWYFAGCAFLYRDDLAGYRKHCEAMLQRFKEDNFEVIRTCTSGPDAVKDMADIVRRAEVEIGRVPSDGWAIINLGMAYYRTGRPREALTAALKGNRDPFWFAHFALMYDAAGQRDEARSWLAKVDEHHEHIWRDVLAGDVKPVPWPWPYDIIRMALIRAETHARLDGKPLPQDPWQRLHSARVYVAAGMTDRADAALAATAASDHAGVLVQRGRLLASMKRLPEALAALDRAVTLQPKDPVPRQERARLYVAMDEPAKAAADFAAALDLTTEKDRASVAGAVAVLDDVFARTTALRPKDGHLWKARFQHFAAHGRWREAASAGAEALAIDPADATVRYQQAPLLLELGDRDGYIQAARAMLERYSETKDPNLAERTAKTCLLLPEGVADIGKLAQLATYSITGTEKHGDHRWFVMCKALSDYRQAEYARSLARCKGLNPSPDGAVFDALVYAMIAMAHQRLDQPKEARQALERARSIVGRKMPQPERGQLFGVGWDDWLRCRALLREASGLIEDGAANRS